MGVFFGGSVTGGGGELTDGDKGDVIVSDGGATFTIDTGVVSYAKMQAVSDTDKILGRSSAGSGAVQEITCTAAGRNLLDDEDADAQRTTLGLGTAAVEAASAFAAASHNQAASTITSGTLAHERGGLEADVSAYDGLVKITGGSTSAITITAAGEAILGDANAEAQRATLGLTIGTHVQAYDAELAAIAGMTSAADRGIYFTGSGTASLFTLTAAGRALVDDDDIAAQRTTLKVPASDPTGVTGADAITNIISLTQAEYNAITPNASTFYIITDAE